MNCSGVARSQRLGAKLRGSGEWKSAAGSRVEPRWRSVSKKHDINFALRITLLSAYCPLYCSYIVTFEIGFSRSNHIHFQSLPYSSLTPPTIQCVHTFHQIFADLRTESRAGWGGGQLLMMNRQNCV